MPEHEKADEKFPKEIRISDEIYASRGCRHYALRFPYHPEAVAVMKAQVGAFFDRTSSLWEMPGHRPERVEAALRSIAQILAREAGLKKGRAVVAADNDIDKGSILETPEGPVLVTGLGAVFRRRGAPGEQRYAYHRSLSEQELALHLEAVAARQDGPIEEPDDPEPV